MPPWHAVILLVVLAAALAWACLFAACLFGAIVLSRRLGPMFVPMAALGLAGTAGLGAGVSLVVAAWALNEWPTAVGAPSVMYPVLALIGAVDAVACPFVIATLALWLLAALSQSSRT
ncbi:MAG: hypothetical protein AB8H79_01200 [Myxococcota bacterium]